MSQKFQIVIPQWARKRAGIKAGQEMLVEVVDDKIELIPIPRFEDLKGAFPELRKGPLIRELGREWHD